MKWIDAKKRLPKIVNKGHFEKCSEAVLVYLGQDKTGDDIYDIGTFTIYPGGLKTWVVAGKDNDDVTYWMPLPDPPKKD